MTREEDAIRAGVLTPTALLMVVIIKTTTTTTRLRRAMKNLHRAPYLSTISP